MDPKIELALRRFLKLPFMAELSRSSKNTPPATYRDWIEKTAAACRALLEQSEKETRDLSTEEKTAFDEGLRLVDYWKTQLGEKDARRGARHVSPEQVWGVERERGSIRGGVDPELRYVTDEGREIRALRPNESIREAFSAELPDGIQPEELSLG